MTHPVREESDEDRPTAAEKAPLAEPRPGPLDGPAPEADDHHEEREHEHDDHEAAAPQDLDETLEDELAEDASTAPMVRLDAVEKSYGERPALGPVTLDLPRGCVGLLGPNGAGKTTLIRTIMGLLPPNTGSVQVLGQTVRPGARKMRQGIGYVPEGEAAFPGLSGVQGVVLAGRLNGMSRAAAMQRAHQVLDYVGLGEARYRLSSGYSTGMRQRLKLAQALVHDPQLLILDEPTEGVDPEARKELLDLITELIDKHDIQVLLSTHLLHDVERIADYTVVLNEGRVVVAGPLEDLRRPQAASYMVRVYGALGPLEEWLDESGVQWSPAPPGLRVELDDPRKIMQHVQDAGLVVRHLAPVQLSLTDAYEEAVVQGGESSD